MNGINIRHIAIGIRGHMPLLNYTAWQIIMYEWYECNKLYTHNMHAV